VRQRDEVIVGAVVLAGLALIVFGTLWLSGAGFGQDTVEVEARFRQVGQLQTGNAVKLRGVPIGRVEEIRLEPDGTGVRVVFRVDASAKLPPDPVVLLSPESFFGDWQAEILPLGRNPRYEYAVSSEPGVLPGYSLPDMSQLTAVADRIAENLAVLTERVSIAFTEETAVRLRDAIANIQSASAELTALVQRQERALGNLAADLDAMTETMARAAGSIERVAVEVESAVGQGQLADIVQNFRDASGQIDSLATSVSLLSRDLRSAAASADTAFHAFQVMGTDVVEGRGTLGRLLRDTTLYAELLRTNQQLQELMTDIKANPRKYIHLEIF